jgi:uncharacterized protein (DUF2235 family)
LGCSVVRVLLGHITLISPEPEKAAYLPVRTYTLALRRRDGIGRDKRPRFKEKRPQVSVCSRQVRKVPLCAFASVDVVGITSSMWPVKSRNNTATVSHVYPKVALLRRRTSMNVLEVCAEKYPKGLH